MRIPRIFTERALSEGAVLALEEAPSRHIGKVLRMQEGRELILFNGQGGEYRASITQVGKKVTEVEIGEFSVGSKQSPLNIELAIGLSKGDRFDLVLQKATELGVSKIVPLLSQRSEVKLNPERLTKKLASWRQIIVGACEQCQLNIVPTLSAPLKLEQWLSGCDSDLKLVLHHRSDGTLADMPEPKSLSLLIGPEGGLNSEEIECAQSYDFKALTLGPRVLRTETAPLAAISLAQYLWGDF
jgi:16S rRNA (uracil1498-N3)-methyltransferase